RARQAMNLRVSLLSYDCQDFYTSLPFEFQPCSSFPRWLTVRLAPRRAKTLLALSALTLALTGCGGGGSESDDGSITLTIAQNSIAGGKNSASAEWVQKWVIPRFEEAQKAAGRSVKVEFQANGVDDEQYKTKIALDLKSKRGADVIDLDGIWIGEFAQAGYIKPLNETAGAAVDSWDGWNQIPEAVQGLGT